MQEINREVYLIKTENVEVIDIIICLKKETKTKRISRKLS